MSAKIGVWATNLLTHAFHELQHATCTVHTYVFMHACMWVYTGVYFTHKNVKLMPSFWANICLCYNEILYIHTIRIIHTLCTHAQLYIYTHTCMHTCIHAYIHNIRYIQIKKHRNTHVRKRCGFSMNHSRALVHRCAYATMKLYMHVHNIPVRYKQILNAKGTCVLCVQMCSLEQHSEDTRTCESKYICIHTCIYIYIYIYICMYVCM